MLIIVFDFKILSVSSICQLKFSCELDTCRTTPFLSIISVTLPDNIRNIFGTPNNFTICINNKCCVYW